MLDIRNLRGGYQGRLIIDGVNLQVAEGEIVTVIGHNGAGKSTLLKAIFNLLPLRKGEIELNGRRLDGLPVHGILAAGLAYVPQGRSVFPRLTVRENLWMGGYLLDDKALLARRLGEVKTLFPILAERRDQLAGQMSGGEQRMLEIARALLLDPSVILLDEPSIGLAPRMVDMVFDTAKLLRDRGKGVLMVEQNVRKALLASDRACVLELGIIRLEDSAAALLDDPRVAQLYMGRAISPANRPRV
jgi:branched-chain amino acid transport system ATP-binding protein